MIFDRHANFKYKYESRNFCAEYYVDTVEKKEKIIAQYVRNKLEKDQVHEQITTKEYIDPTGSKKR